MRALQTIDHRRRQGSCAEPIRPTRLSKNSFARKRDRNFLLFVGQITEKFLPPVSTSHQRQLFSTRWRGERILAQPRPAKSPGVSKNLSSPRAKNIFLPFFRNM
jgi:hypothetical protein